MIWVLSNNFGSSFMEAEYSDKDCLRNFSNGDNDAFRSLFRKYEQPVIRYVYGLTFDAELSKDICQETFLQLINNPPVFLFGGSVKPWLFKVARNKAVDALRRRRVKGEGESELAVLSSTFEAHPSEIHSDDEMLGDLRKAMGKLPENYREIVSLHIYGGLTFNEISKLLGIPLGTALWRMQKAVSLLKEEMEK